MRNFFVFVFALTLLAATGFTIYKGIVFYQVQYKSMNDDFVALFWLFALLMIVCTLVIAGAIRAIAMAGDKNVHPEKAVVYGKLMDYIAYQNPENKLSGEWQRVFVLWASTDVLAKFIKWQKTHQFQQSSAQIEKSTQQLLVEMRRDLGHKNITFSKENVMQLVKVTAGHD